MENERYRARVIARASWLGIIGNGVLAVLTVSIGFIGNSLALIGVGIDTITDVATSVVTLLTSRIIQQPPDEQHPYGHGRAETIATKLLAFIIFFAGTQLVISTVSHLFTETERSLPSMVTFFGAGISIIGKLILAILKRRAGKKVQSAMLIADAKNMTMDIFISGSVLLGIFFAIKLGMPLVDTLLGLCVGLWIMKEGYGIFMETNVELMDGLRDRGMYRSVCRAALSVEGVMNPHKMRIRKINTRYVIDIDIEVDGSFTVLKGHELAMLVEERIHTQVKNVYDVNVHVEPLGNLEADERFGLSQECLRKKDKTDEE